MATPTPSPIVQVVGRGQDKGSGFRTQDMKELIKNYCSNPNAHYTVFSIVGAQSSGKSTLMNALFETSFQVMDAKKGRKATTKGIWAALCNQYRTLVLDVEGSDGAEHQEDASFENQSALFALLVSDAIFVNIGINDIGRLNGGSIPLLHRIFQERVNYDMHNTVMIFTVRDYDGETSVDALREQLTSEVQKIYSQFPENESATLRERIELHFEFLHHKKYATKEFENDCKKILDSIASNKFVRHEWPVDLFPSIAERFWKDILENKMLLMAHYWDTISRLCCMRIKSQNLSSLESNKDYQSLKNSGQEYHPGVFCKELDKILKSILSDYDKQSERYNIEVAQDVRKILRAEVIEDAKRAFSDAMDNFVTEFLEKTLIRIQRLLKENLFENMELIVKQNCNRFMQETKDLDLYKDIVEQSHQEVHGNLKLLTRSVRDKAVLGFVGKYAPTFLMMSLGVISAAAGGGIVMPIEQTIRAIEQLRRSTSNLPQNDFTDCELTSQDLAKLSLLELDQEEVPDEAKPGTSAGEGLGEASLGEARKTI